MGAPLNEQNFDSVCVRGEHMGVCVCLRVFETCVSCAEAPEATTKEK